MQDRATFTDVVNRSNDRHHFRYNYTRLIHGDNSSEDRIAYHCTMCNKIRVQDVSDHLDHGCYCSTHSLNRVAV